MSKKTKTSIFIAMIMLLILAQPALKMPLMSYKGIILFFVAVYLWASELVAVSVTSLILFCLVPVMGIMNLTDTFSVMGNVILWRLLAIFLITQGMEKSGLAKRIALLVLRYSEGDLYRLLFLMQLLTFVFVFIVPAVAARTAIIAVICMGVVKKIAEGSGKEDFAKSVSIAIPITSLVTSSSVMVGSMSALYTVGYLENLLNEKVTYLWWLRITLPANLLMIPIIYFIIIKVFPFERKDEKSLTYLREEIKNIGILSVKEKKMIVLMFFLIVFWISGFMSIPGELIIATIMFFPGIEILERREAFRNVAWETILLFGSGLLMAKALSETGAIEYLAQYFTRGLNTNNSLFLAVNIIFITVVLRLGMANMTGVIAVLLPVLTSFALVMGSNPVWAIMICAMSSSLGILLPSQSSSTMTTFVYGYFSFKDMFKVGSLVVIAYATVIVIFAHVYWPKIGLFFL